MVLSILNARFIWEEEKSLKQNLTRGLVITLIKIWIM